MVGGLRLAWQPIVAIGERDATPKWVEALIRPGNQQPAGPFVRKMLKARQAAVLDTWVIRRAIHAPAARVSVNLFASSLRQHAILDALVAAAQTIELCVEVLEHVPLRSADYAALRALQSAGALIALDDVDNRNDRCQADFWKMSVETVRRRDDRVAREASMRAVPLIVEGVETEDDLSWARNIGAAYGQGFYWGAATSELAEHPVGDRSGHWGPTFEVTNRTTEAH